MRGLPVVNLGPAGGLQAPLISVQRGNVLIVLPPRAIPRPANAEHLAVRPSCNKKRDSLRTSSFTCCS